MGGKEGRRREGKGKERRRGGRRERGGGTCSKVLGGIDAPVYVYIYLLVHTDIFAVSLAFSLTFAVAAIAKFVFIMSLPHRAEALKRCFCLTMSVCLSVCLVHRS